MSGSKGAGSSDTNPLKEFESAYAALIGPLTAEDQMFNRSNEPFRIEEDKINEFLAKARNLENFFLQRRQWIYAHKPEDILREDGLLELKQEVQRKDKLISNHFEKLSQWQELLQDMQSSEGPPGATATPGSAQGPGPGPSSSKGPPDVNKGKNMAPRGATPIVPPNIAPGSLMQPGAGAPQGGFVPGNNYRMQQPGMSNAGGMRDPLFYLEKTATSAGNQMPR